MKKNIIIDAPHSKKFLRTKLEKNVIRRTRQPE
jgi:hypothetical protein